MRAAARLQAVLRDAEDAVPPKSRSDAVVDGQHGAESRAPSSFVSLGAGLQIGRRLLIGARDSSILRFSRASSGLLRQCRCRLTFRGCRRGARHKRPSAIHRHTPTNSLTGPHALGAVYPGARVARGGGNHIVICRRFRGRWSRHLTLRGHHVYHSPMCRDCAARHARTA